MAITPDAVGVTPGAGKNVAVYDITEGGGRVIQRNSLNDPLGNPLTIGGPTVAVALTPTVTTGALYGANFVVGGVMDFANVFGAAGAGVVRFVRVTCNQMELQGLTLYLLNADPISSTFNDNAAASINAADTTKVIMTISLDPDSQLGAHTIWAATVDVALSIGATDLFGVLVIDGALSNEFTSTSDVTVELTATQDI